MDEALASVVVDLSNRPYLVYNVPKLSERVGEFETQLVQEFFRAFTVNGGVTMHVNASYGDNSHHLIEAIFKAWARTPCLQPKEFCNWRHQATAAQGARQEAKGIKENYLDP